MLVGLVLAIGCAGSCGKKPAPLPPRAVFNGVSAHPDHALIPQSTQCAVCHGEIFQIWSDSHHAWANRTTKPHLDAAPFQAGEVAQGKNTRWTFAGGGKPELVWRDGGQEIKDNPTLVIGRTPLIQYLVSIGKGRYQAPDMAWDTLKKEWFSIYGDEDRRPQEWGHWSQRGMNWNSQCAWCHMTGFRKNHDVAGDAYHSTWVEQGVGCAQCHGPVLKESAAPNCMVATKRALTPRQHMDNCATCHARREEFDEGFTPGDNFHDRYRLALPSQPGLYYPDGQQRDEVYNFTSLLLSKMGHAGVTCLDCHEPHLGKVKLGVDDNTLCMQCHGPGKEVGVKKAQIINPLDHMFHAPGTPGGKCVDCHMKKTPYMGRDPRHDHAFIIPDPLLTKELGVPNACTDCHKEKGVDWEIEWTDKWYGDKMKRPERERTRAVAMAYAGNPAARDALLAVYPTQEIGAWKATLLRLMDPWAGEDRVNAIAHKAVADPDPLVRAAAASVLGPQSGQLATTSKMFSDPIKAVRIEAAWAAMDHLPLNLPVVAEAEAVANHQSDQPGGAMRMARLAMRKQDHAAAEQWFQRALAWDQTAAAPRRDFAVFLAGQGRVQESKKWLVEAAALEPTNPEIPYLLALAHAESNDMAAAESQFREVLKRDPRFARAHYNLGLLLSSQGKDDAAIASLRAAEEADPASPDAPYARATIHARRGDRDAARAAATEALRRNPAYPPALQLLQGL